MTTSPYDNLPSGNNDMIFKSESSDSNDASPKYIDVHVDSPAPKSVKRTKTIPLSPAPKYSNKPLKNICGCYEYILPFEESLLVPDTMPDMLKVLFADGRVDLALTDKLSYDFNDFLAGDITIYTVYRPTPSAHSPAAGPAAYNDCPVDVVKSSIPFKTDKCWSAAEGETFRAAVHIKTISSEMINERKFTVKGELLIKMTGIADFNLKSLESCADTSLVTAASKANITELTYETSDTVEISQEITLKENLPKPIKILKPSINIIENHRQITSGKLVINASIKSQILYLGDTESGEKKLATISTKTDFTQFIVIDNDTDPELIKLTFNCSTLRLDIENKDRFLLEGTVTTLINSYSDRDINMIHDAYHKENPLHFDVTSYQLNSLLSSINGEISAREVIDLTGINKTFTELICGTYYLPSVTGRFDSDKIVIEGSIPVKILALDSENTPFIAEHTVPIKGFLTAPETSCLSASDISLNICIDTFIKEFWCGGINNSQIEINLALALTAWIISENTFHAIDNLCFEECSEPPERISMAICVAGRGDTLWSIAKHYKTDVDTLATLNEIEPTTQLSEGTKLLIMK